MKWYYPQIPIILPINTWFSWIITHLCESLSTNAKSQEEELAEWLASDDSAENQQVLRQSHIIDEWRWIKTSILGMNVHVGF